MIRLDTEKRIRAMELVLVLSLSFLPAFLTSLASFSGIGFFGKGPHAADARFISNIVMFLTVIAVLLYVLRRRDIGLSRIGFSFVWGDLPVSWLITGIAFLAMLISVLIYVSLFSLITRHRPDLVNPALGLFQSRFTVWYLLFLIIDPFFEELIMRAYLMTEMEFLTGSTAVAVIVSTVLQASYHLYEGYGVIPIGVMFLVYSLYYARYRRIMPVILAHLLWDSAVLAHLLLSGVHP